MARKYRWKSDHVNTNSHLQNCNISRDNDADRVSNRLDQNSNTMTLVIMVTNWSWLAPVLGG